MIWLLLSLWLSPSTFAARPCPTAFAAVSARAADGVLYLSGGRAVRYLVHRSAGKPKGTVLILNGLTSHLDGWNEFVAALQKSDFDVVQMAFSGQQDSLLRLKNARAPFLSEPITRAMLVEEIEAVLAEAKGRGPLNITTWSFGAMAGMEFAAKHPGQVKMINLITPLTKPFDKYNPEAIAATAAFEQMAAAAKLWDPFGLLGTARKMEAMQTDAYRNTVMSSLDKYEEGEDFLRGLDKEVFKKGITELTMGARDFELAGFASTDLPRVNMILSRDEFFDQMKEDQLAFFRSLPASSRGSLVALDAFGHNDMLGDAEAHTLDLTQKLLAGKLKAGMEYGLDTKTGAVKKGVSTK